MSKNSPLVSVLTICLNSERTIRRCLESILLQDYPNIEYVIQDGGSTDGTLAIIDEYRRQYGERIRLVSERDDGPDDAHFRGLGRCRGDIIGLCWADEEYLPGAIAWGVRQLAMRQEVAAVYGDVYQTDLDGRILNPDTVGRTPAWDVEKFLCWEMIPSYCASFFRAKALHESGFFEFRPATDCCMYDYYARVGMRSPICYVPGAVAKFSVHPGQLSSTPAVLWRMVRSLESSLNHLLEDPCTLARFGALRERAYAGFRLSMLDSLVKNADAIEDAKEMLTEALQYQPNLDFLERMLGMVFHDLSSRGRYDDVLDLLDIVFEHGLTNSCLKLWKAMMLWYLGRSAAAQQVLSEALTDVPKSPQLENGLVGIYNIFARQGRYVETLDFLDTVLACGFIISVGQLLRAGMLYRLGRFSECAEALRLQLSIAPEYAPQVRTLLQGMQKQQESLQRV